MYKTRTFQGKKIYNYELFQMDVEANLPAMLSKKPADDMNVLLVGAWHGDEIRSFLKWPNSKIWAFEPNPTNFKYLKERYSNNPRVKCFDYACGEENGSAILYEANITGNDSLLKIKEDAHIKLEKTHNVQVRRLDSIAELKNIHIDLLWIDAQGFELPILKGAIPLLANTSSLFLEINEDDRTYNEATTSGNLRSFLEQKGFRVAHQENDGTGESGSALFITNKISTNAYDSENAVEERTVKALENRSGEIVFTKNPLYKILSRTLPSSFKAKLKKILSL